MAKALIVYASRTNKTKKLADFIAEGLKAKDVDVTVKKVNEIKNESDMAGYDAVVLGSPTYHGQMMQPMQTMLFLAEKANLEGKVGGAFGAFGWSGEAPQRIFDTMKNIFNMDMVSGPLRVKSAAIAGSGEKAREYAAEIAAKLS
ncbi:MAG TPA: FprA family A-type flavoprotein [Deltaproteobacteria bacterium]|nr:FprA family A-type flavoprotein [Deltaproteobacteria bacterium]